MKKQTICGFITLLSGLLAITDTLKLDAMGGLRPHGAPTSAVLGLLSAIFAAQWAEYRGRPAAQAQPGIPGWLRKLLFSGLLLLTVLSANAQTTWTRRYQTPNYILSDVAYGAGKYVTVGNNDLIQISSDGITWTTQVAASQSAGGFSKIVYANGQFVAVGTFGRVITSPDGLTWSSQASGTTEFLWGISYGGGRFIAVGDGGIAITSTDGTAWSTLTTGTSVDLNDITYGNGTFTIVGDGGLIRTTPNGIIWTAKASGTAVALKGVTAGSNGELVAVGSNNTVVRSPNGIVWTAQVVAGTPLFLSAVTYDPAQSLYVAVADDSSHQLLRSPDGINWSPWSSGTSLSLYGVRYVNGRFIAVGQLGIILSSLNGINWYPLTISHNAQFNAVTYGNGHYVAVGKYPINLQPAIGSVAATSTDGITYTLGTTEHFAGADEGFNDVVWGNGQFVAVGGEAIIQTSVDGKVWKLRYSNFGTALFGVAYGAGQYVAVGAGFGAGINLLRSPDGTTWTKSANGLPASYFGITHANGQFVAVGSNGAIATSPEGIDWAAYSSGTNKALTSVVYGNGTYVAVGVGGTVIKSVNSTNWSTVPFFTTNDINRVTFGNGQFVTVGENGELFTSPDGTVWTARPSKSEGNTLNGITHGNGLFLAVGDEATFTTSPDDGGQPPANQPPTVANAIPNQMATMGQNFSYLIPAGTFSDPNGDALTLSIGGLPNGLTLNGSTISGTPTTVQAPTVTVMATDPGNLAVSTQFTITVSAASPVNPGSFAITGVTLVSCNPISAGQRQLIFSPQYSGLSGQPISFSVANEMLPTTNAGPYTLNMYTDNPSITLKATQSGTAGEASFGYNWLSVCNGGVPPVNQAPIAPVIPNTTGMVGQVYSLLIPPFTDPEGLPLTYSVTGLPPGLLVGAGGNISGPPTLAGVYVITVTATDPGGLSASATYTLTISPAGGNPGAFAITGVSLVSCNPISATQRQLFFSPQYSGLSGQPISFSVANEMLPTTNAGPYTLNMYTDNPVITLKAIQSGTAGEGSFVYNWLVACGLNGARLGANESAEGGLAVRVLGNPVEDGVLSIEVRGAGGQPLSLIVSDMRGQVVGRHGVGQAGSVEEHRFGLGHQPAGLYLLRVSTASQTRTVKVMKQ